MITFHYKDKNRKQQCLVVHERYFKAYLIELLEDEQLDLVSDIYYTIGNVTKKADYYNEEL